MATRQEIIDDLNTRLAPLVSKIVQSQTAYFDARGRYAQLPPILSNVLAEGTEATPNNVNADFPNRKIDGWAKLASQYGFQIPPMIKSNISVYNYDGPLGEGYVIVAEHIIKGRLARRVLNVGPETWRNKPWREV